MKLSGEEPVPALTHNELDYARGAVVGSVVVDERTVSDGSRTLVIKLQRVAPLFRAGLFRTSLGALVATIALAAKFQFARQFSSAEFFWIVGAMAGLGWIISGVKQMLDAGQSRTIQITRENVSLLFRHDRSMRRADFPRASVADVLLIPSAGLLQLLAPGSKRVQAALSTGERVELHLGTSAESTFLRSVIAHELQLPAEQWVDALGTRLPALSRLKIRMDPFGVQLDQPARATWVLLLLTAILTPTMPFIVAWVSTLGGRSWHNVWERDTAPLLSAVLTLIAGLALCAIVYHFRREASITINPKSIVLSESHPFRPALSEWPISQVDSFVVRGARRRGSATSIDLVFKDGSPAAPLLERLRRRDLAAAYDALQTGLQRARATAAN